MLLKGSRKKRGKRNGMSEKYFNSGRWSSSDTFLGAWAAGEQMMSIFYEVINSLGNKVTISIKFPARGRSSAGNEA